MKVLGVTANDSETSTEIEIQKHPELSKSVMREVKNQIGEYIKEQVLLSINDLKSPVAGEGWPRLSKKYRKTKEEEGYTPVANLQAEGDLLDAFEYKITDSGIKLGVFGSEAPKADGHLKFSGKTNGTPKRRFLPDEGQTFKAKIEKETERIIADAVSENAPIDKKDLEDVSTTADLYAVLSPLFEGLPRAEIKAAVFRSETLFDILNAENLLELL